MFLLWMSITGSIPLIIFLVSWLVQRNSFNYPLGKILLYLSMVFYLVPFQLLTRILPEKVYDVTVIEKIRTLNTSQFHFEYGNSAYLTINDGIMWVPRWLIFILCIWFAVVLLFAIYQVAKYRRSMRYLLRISEEKTYDLIGIGTVSVLINNEITTPYTVGFIRPRIIFPESLIESKYNTLIYRHEYCHAKNHDALIKLICLVIICLHWFNPVAILLLFSYGVLCEYVSDDYAAEGLTDKQRKEYANLLIDVAATKTMPVVWRNNFLSTKHLLKRRLTYIMKKRFGKIQKLVTVVISVVTVVASAMTVLAYEPLQSSSEDVIAELEDGDFVYFGLDDSFCLEEVVVEDIDFSGHEDIFITDDGEYIIINNDSSYAICNHTFGSGKLAKHLNNGNGGCTVKLYNAQICTKCNYVVLGDLINVVTYAVCPH